MEMIQAEVLSNHLCDPLLHSGNAFVEFVDKVTMPLQHQVGTEFWQFCLDKLSCTQLFNICILALAW